MGLCAKHSDIDMRLCISVFHKPLVLFNFAQPIFQQARGKEHMNALDKELAVQAGFWKEHTNTWMCSSEDIEIFADLIRADEREACAKVCDDYGKNFSSEGNKKLGIANDLQGVAEASAEAIRARGNKNDDTQNNR